MEAYVEGGRVVKVKGMREHPLNNGRLCPKGSVAHEYIYARDRITTPMLNEDGRWKKIDWDLAFDILVENLKEIREENPESFATIIGMPILLGGSSTVGFIRRFMDVYGTPNCFSPESMCYRHQIIGYILTTGKFSVADVENSNCIVVWGHNPHASKPPLAWRIEKSRKRGAYLIVIDPRKTKVAKMADIHLPIKPGTDIYLALGFMKVIVEEGLYDADFVSKFCYGFEELKKHLNNFSLEEISKITWIDVEDIVDSARLFAKTKPACIVQGVNALDQNPSGIQNSRSIAMLHALTGNIDVKGGFVRAGRVHTRNLRLPELLKNPPLGIREHPLFYQIWNTYLGEGQGMYLYDAVIKGHPYKIRGIFVSGSNPVLTWPDTNKTVEMLKEVEFLAVMDMFMTETAKHADLFLPAGSFLERWELVDYYSVIFGIPYMMLRKKVIQPLGDSKGDVEFWLELARRMGFKEHFPWKSVEEVIDWVLEPTEYSFDDLNEKYPSGVWSGEVKYLEYLKRGFKTPSKKVELYSKTLEQLNLPPLPSPIHERGEEDEVLIITGARDVYYTHSQMRNVERLRKFVSEPYAEINPETARKYGIRDGEYMIIKTERGSIKIMARFTEDIAKNVVSIPHGWAEGNVNVLTPHDPADPISGCPMLKGIIARAVEKEQLVERRE